MNTQYHRFPSLTGLTVGMALLANAAVAQNTNHMSERRDLRVACLESFNTAQSRLEDLRQFVSQQSIRERGAADQLFQLQQNAASARREQTDLRHRATVCSNRLDEARAAVDRAAASHRAALADLPNGDAWAADGSVALTELRRAAAATPRDTWKHKRVKEVEAEFVGTLREWRSARRSIEQAGFDLELRAAPSAFKRVGDEITSVSGELKTLEKQLAERQSVLATQAKESEKWGAAIRELREGEDKARKGLADAAFEFHLVDLKFAAWRLKKSGEKDEGMEALPDALEQAIEPKPAPAVLAEASKPELVASPALARIGGRTTAAAEKEEVAGSEESDAKFRDLLARVNLAQDRLRFISQLWESEAANVSTAISKLDDATERTHSLAADTAGLAADLESLRRSLENEQRLLTAGAETLHLVNKRFATDLDAINHLLNDTTDRTAKLEKSLK